MDKGKILDRIQKLLALAKSTSYPAEAEAAMAKVQDLLLKYNIELHEVENLPAEEDRVIVREYIPLSADGWERLLYHGVAIGNMCSTIYEPDHRRLAVIGTAGNVAVTIYSVSWLLPRVRQMAVNYWTFAPDDGTPEGKWKASFLMGVASGIIKRAEEQTQRYRAEDFKALMVIDANANRVNAAIKGWYPRLFNRHFTVDGSGYGIGYRAGQDVAVQPRVENRDNRLLR